MTPRKRNPKITEKDRPKRIRAVYYVRQSTEGQDDLLSPESQIRKIKAFAEREGIEMVGGYEDIAISGSSTENRRGFQRMIADATSSKNLFEMIIVYDISRFSRKTLDLLQLRRPAEKARRKAPVRNRTPLRRRSLRRILDPHLSRQRSDAAKDGQENPRQPV